MKRFFFFVIFICFAILCSSIGTKLTWKRSLTPGGVDEKRTGIQKRYKQICNILSVGRGLSPPDKRNNINFLLRHTLVLVLDRSHRTCTYLLSVCCFISDELHVWLRHSFASKLYSADGFSSRSCQSEQWMCVSSSPIHFSPHPIFWLFLRYKKCVNISIYADEYAYIFCSFRSFVVSKFSWKIKCKVKLTTKIDWHDPCRFCQFFLSFVLRYGTILSTQTTVNIYLVSVCLCLSVRRSIHWK